jgi:hypothetical protein
MQTKIPKYFCTPFFSYTFVYVSGVHTVGEFWLYLEFLYFIKKLKTKTEKQWDRPRTIARGHDPWSMAM